MKPPHITTASRMLAAFFSYRLEATTSVPQLPYAHLIALVGRHSRKEHDCVLFSVQNASLQNPKIAPELPPTESVARVKVSLANYF